MSEVTGVEKNTEPQFKFCWVVALRAEAAPLIDAFNMKVVENKSLLFVNLSKGMICGTLTKLFTQMNRQTAWNIFFASVHHCNNSAIDIF